MNLITDAIFTAAESCSCTALEGDPMCGWHLMTIWEDAQPGDILYDGELWMACRACNWGDGLPLEKPKGAIVLSVPGGLWAMPWDTLSYTMHSFGRGGKAK